MIAFSDALKLVLDSALELRSENIALENSTKRVLANDVKSDRDYPPFNRSAMDGIAIRYQDWENDKLRDFRITQSVYAGDSYYSKPLPWDCVKIMTGASVPLNFDTVVRVEDLDIKNDKVSIQTNKITKGMNIALRGEDTRTGQVLINKGTLITPRVVGLLATIGQDPVLVHKQPTVHIISTGNEIKDPTESVGPTEIRDSNGPFLLSALKKLGLESVSLSRCEDSKDKLTQAIQHGLNHDLLILTGGVSMGDADYVPELLQKKGVQQIFHKVAQKPGKPIWFGSNAETVVFGLPGNPVSVQVMFKVFIEPFIHKSMGLLLNSPKKLKTVDAFSKKNSFRQFVPVQLTESGEITRLKYNGSGDILAPALSDGLLVIPEEIMEINQGEMIEFIPW